MNTIKNIIARQILDSRGNPTVECDIIFDCGSFGRGVSPSGASTGKLEAIELRDGDENTYNGKSVLRAVSNINKIIKKAVVGNKYESQEDFDNLLIEIDSTANKNKLGANAILATSIAYSHATANSKKQNLFENFGNNFSLPVPLMNILNGGMHANNNLDFQEFMILPINFSSFSDSLRAGCEIFHSLKKILSSKNYSTAVGDEGGFAPNINSNEEALDLILNAVSAAGYKAGENIFIGLDVASSEFYKNNLYVLGDDKSYDSSSFCDYIAGLCSNYPIISVEDGMAEDDWDGWIEMTSRLGNKVQLVGDDIFVTNPEILQKGIEKSVANSILIKLNQIGTVSETIKTINLARDANYTFIISHRSGETEDTTIADLSVGTASNQIKTGSLSRSDRVAKYNRLLRIEEILGGDMFNKNDVFSRWLN